MQKTPCSNSTATIVRPGMAAGEELTATVVGAGIAGLAAAKALADLDYEVRVLERERKLRTEGAGLSLWPNAVRALQEIGLGDVVEGSGQVLATGATLRPDGETIAMAPLDRIAARFGPLLSVHRGELLAALRERVKAPIEFGADVCVMDGVLSLGGEPLAANLILGTDGIRSAVRELVAPGVAPRPAGYSAWRGVAHTGGLTPAGALETLGRGRRFGLVPLSGERTYWFAVLADGGAHADLEAAFEGWHEPIAAVLAATPASERSYLELCDLRPLPRWHSGSHVLLGDAAHGMTPNLGQGAAQALLDVAALAREFAANRPLADALRAYERARKRPAERIVRQSRAMGRIAQTTNPLAARLRDTLARHTPAALMTHQIGRTLH
jgi:2-polyprenyl-6-methoxyphenol hydroxylase-like FAD-dependent oxidoreductase